MEEIMIRGKTFTKEEIITYGKKHIHKLSVIFRSIGIPLTAFAALILIVAISSSIEDAASIPAMILAVLSFAIPAIIMMVLAFKKRDPYEYGVAYINNHFPAPLGFDGKVIEVLEGDKTIDLSKKPVSRLTIQSSTKQFQLLTENHYSNIFLPKDLVDYEIRVDNEVVITSKTKTKKGVGKAVAGGLLFGEAGAIAGAVAGNSKSTTTQTQKEIHHYSLVLKVNDLTKPSFIVNIDSVQIAEDVVTSLDILVGNTKKIVAEETTQPEAPKEAPKLDKFDELKKYKELLDAGVITQEEFDKKKKELIG